MTEFMRMLKTFLCLVGMSFLLLFPLSAQDETRYVEVVGTSEVLVVPDKIHYVIEIREYFMEEFYANSKPEDYRTKMSITKIEKQLFEVLDWVKIPREAVRVQEVGDYWRKEGQDFLISKRFDVVLQDFKQIDELVKRLNTRGIHSMRIGELENKDIRKYLEQGKIEALKAAQSKAAYLVASLGKKLGPVLRIVEEGVSVPYAQHTSNAYVSHAESFDQFRTIKLDCSMRVRFSIAD